MEQAYLVTDKYKKNIYIKFRNLTMHLFIDISKSCLELL